jgi:NitT/TauT family transport system ATP-binding protein
VEERAIEFPRPRTIETTFKPEFTDLTQRLREAIVAVRSASTGLQAHEGEA